MSESDNISNEGSVEREPGSPREMQDGCCQTDRLSSSSSTSESHSTVDSPESPDKPRAIPWIVKLEQARDFKAQGNDRYVAGQYKQAIGKYHRALLFVKGIQAAQQSMPFMPETEEYQQSQRIPKDAELEVDELKVAIYNNLAACILNTEGPAYSKVIEYCDHVLQISPNNTKALYRKAVALFHMHNVEKALQTLEVAKQQPNGASDKNIQKYTRLCEQELSRQDVKLKKTYQAMFEKMAVEGQEKHDIDDVDLDDDEDVFSTSPDKDPKVVTPSRKLKKARSTDTSPY